MKRDLRKVKQSWKVLIFNMRHVSFCFVLLFSCNVFGGDGRNINGNHHEFVSRMRIEPDSVLDIAPTLNKGNKDNHQPREIKENNLSQRKHEVKSDEVSFTFAKHFQNSMVLQRAPARANIYGFSPDIGQKVIAQMVTPSKPYYYSTKIEEGSTKGVGIWRITLDAMEAGTTVTIRVISERGTLNLANVIFGDVWLCGGQSNMQFDVAMMEGAAEEIADSHNYPNIRLMTVSLKESATPLDDVIAIQLPWSAPNNATVAPFSAVCWLYGKNIHKSLGIPIGLVASDWGGTPVEAWSSPEALKRCGVSDGSGGQDKTDGRVLKKTSSNLYTPDNPPSPGSDDLRVGGPGANSHLWNSMIHPLLGMTIYGAIWYQGEADASGTKMNNYNCTFPTMIQDWRDKFSQASGQTNSVFPFGFVQLAAYRPNPAITVGFTDIRWHQTADVGFVPNHKMPRVFMAVAMDLPDFNSTYGAIHPRDKIDVGYRLALSGLAIAYDKKELYNGPFPQKGGFVASGYLVSYGSTWVLEVRDKEGFEFYCQPNNGSLGKWVPTAITKSTQTSITLLPSVCGKDEKIAGLRYAWRESPCNFKKCAIYSSLHELPAPPFVFMADSAKNEVKFQGPISDGHMTF